MKKKKIILNTGMLLCLSFFSTIFTLIAISSCNNETNKSENSLTDSTSTTPDAEEEAMRIVDATYFLRLKDTVLQKIFNYGNGKQIKEIYFEFTVVKKHYSLNVYGIDSNKTQTPHYPLEILSSENPVKNSKNLIRKDQQIRRGELKYFLGLPTGTNETIPNDQFKDIYLMAGIDQDPRHPGQNLMFLFYSDDLTKLKGGTLKVELLKGSGATNPSPPAPPCTTECDN